MAVTSETFTVAYDKIAATFPESVKVAEFKKGRRQDPVTGLKSEPVKEVVQGIIGSFEFSQIDGKAIQRGDQQLLVKSGWFTELTPRVEGVQVTIEGVNYFIVAANIDPLNVMWVIQLRQS